MKKLSVFGAAVCLIALSSCNDEKTTEVVIIEDVIYDILPPITGPEVDKIDIVEPADVSRLSIEKGQDYVTLVTCTPYGINTHRLLVRGKRVATKNLDSEFVNADAYPLDKITVTVVSSIPLAIVILIGMRIHYRRKKAKQKNNESEDRKNYK